MPDQVQIAHRSHCTPLVPSSAHSSEPEKILIRAPQTFAEIKEIILSLKSVKGVRLEVSAALCRGNDFAETADQDEYTGSVDRWYDPKEKTTLMV